MPAPRDVHTFADMKYVRVYTGDDGQSHIEHLEMDLESRDFAPPAPPVDVSAPIAASAALVASFPAGWKDDAHPAPARQWLFVMTGRARLSAGGETVELSPAVPTLLEDTTGPGHATEVLEDSTTVFVRI